MAVICIAGVARGIGKTTVAEVLLPHLGAWAVARVRVGDEVPAAEESRLADADWVLLEGDHETAGDDDVGRLVRAGGARPMVLLAQPRGLRDGLAALAQRVPAGGHLLVEGNAFLWDADADMAIMVIGPGRSGKGLVPVRPSVRELFGKIGLWVWNARTRAADEGFFEFPQALARMGFHGAVSNRADFHHVTPCQPAEAGNAAFLEAVRRRLHEGWADRGAKDFLRRIGFDEAGPG